MKIMYDSIYVYRYIYNVYVYCSYNICNKIINYICLLIKKLN